MKRTLAVLILGSLLQPLASQAPANIRSWEFSVSVNRSFSYITNSDNGTGYGAGANLLFNQKGSFTMVSGIEYNYTQSHEEEGDYSHFYEESGLHYTAHLVSIPLGFRYYFGKKRSFYVESGLYADKSIVVLTKGTVCSYAPTLMPDSTWQMLGGCRDFERGGSGFRAGLYTGMAYRVKLKGCTLAIRPDVKWAFPLMIYGDIEGGYDRYFRISLILGFR